MRRVAPVAGHLVAVAQGRSQPGSAPARPAAGCHVSQLAICQ